MGLESASMRQCLLWYNFIVRGNENSGAKDTDRPLIWRLQHRPGNGNVYMYVCVGGGEKTKRIIILFLSLLFLCHPSCFERCEANGAQPPLMRRKVVSHSAYK